ncbi:MAG: RNA polymerase sigma factor [Nitriliruptorales bacterium]|nr:RNA polymerase sigma factor [Nitriliruptorales bacterium]
MNPFGGIGQGVVVDVRETPLQTDAAIIAAAHSKPAVFEQLFDRHYDAIHGFLVRRVGPDTGEELAAEVFTTAFAQRDRYDTSRPNARPWLYGIATNLIRRHARSRFRARRAYARAAVRPTTDVDLDAAASRLDAERDASDVAAAVATLKPRDRDVLLLLAWEDLSYEEIAEALDIPIGTVRSRLNRARSVVRTALAEGRRADG